MSCNECLNFRNNDCFLGKHETLGKFVDGDKVRTVSPCIFRNTQHPNLSFKMAHQLAMSNVAIAAYYFVNKSNYEDLIKLMESEKAYIEDSLIGQFNVVVEKQDFSLTEFRDLSNKLNELNHSTPFNHRMWSLSIPEDVEKTQESGIPLFIINHCKLPYFMILESEKDFVDAQTFKFKCFAGPVPKDDKIRPINKIREILSNKDTKDAQIQTEYTI